MDAVDIGAKAGLGAVTLFPLLAEFKALKGFVPSQRRQWFIVLATIVSVAVYTWVVFFIQSFRHLIWWMWALAAGVFLLLLYLPLLFVEKDWSSHSKAKNATYGALIAVLLVIYIGVWAAFTYAFNTANQLRTHFVFDGALVAADTAKPLSGAAITFGYSSGNSIIATTDSKGRFFKIVPSDNWSSIRVRHGTPGDPDSYCRTWLAREFDRTPDLIHSVWRCQPKETP